MDDVPTAAEPGAGELIVDLNLAGLVYQHPAAIGDGRELEASEMAAVTMAQPWATSASTPASNEVVAASNPPATAPPWTVKLPDCMPDNASTPDDRGALQGPRCGQKAAVRVKDLTIRPQHG